MAQFIRFSIEFPNSATIDGNKQIIINKNKFKFKIIRHFRTVFANELNLKLNSCGIYSKSFSLKFPNNL